MKEDSPPGHRDEARSVAHPPIDEEATVDTNRVEHEGHGAGGVNGGRQVTLGQGDGTAPEDVVDRDRHRRLTRIEASWQEPLQVVPMRVEHLVQHLAALRRGQHPWPGPGSQKSDRRNATSSSTSSSGVTPAP